MARLKNINRFLKRAAMSKHTKTAAKIFGETIGGAVGGYVGYKLADRERRKKRGRRGRR